MINKKSFRMLIWLFPVFLLINCGGSSAVFSNGAAISDSSATTSTIPEPPSSTLNPSITTTTTPSVLSTSTTLPVLSTSTTLPVLSTSTTLPVLSTSTTMLVITNSTTTTLPATTTTTTSTTMLDPNAYYSCKPFKSKYHPRHKHWNPKDEDEDEEEIHWGCAKEHKQEPINDDDLADYLDDDDSPHHHDIESCAHHKHRLTQPKPDDYQCPKNTYARIRICHVPHGDPSKAHTIHVSLSSLAAHLDKADYEGPCKDEYQGRKQGQGLVWKQQWWKLLPPLKPTESQNFLLELLLNYLNQQLNQSK